MYKNEFLLIQNFGESFFIFALIGNLIQTILVPFIGYKTFFFT
jgi:hypothetical protein